VIKKPPHLVPPNSPLAICRDGHPDVACRRDSKAIQHNIDPTTKRAIITCTGIKYIVIDRL
jgi:hypothetical protein